MVYHFREGIIKVKSRISWSKAGIGMVATGLVATAAVSFSAGAAPLQVVVTPSNAHGWTTDDTRPGGSVAIIADATAPGMPHSGAVRLLTDGTNAAKAQYMHSAPAGTKLSDITELSYQTKQNAASFSGGDASYQLPVCLLGMTAPVTLANPTGCNGFTTLVYEPYENGTVTANTWQSWDVDAGQFWSSKTVNAGACSTTAGFGGAPFYVLSSLGADCPDAIVAGFGVNIGSYNPGYDVEADLVNFNGTTYNFEPYEVATDKNACKDGGWQSLADVNGNSFKNQGQCVSYVAAKKS